MKKIFLKSLLVLIGVLITSLTTPMRAWWQLYWNGNFTTGDTWDVKEYIIQYSLGGGSDGNAHRFLPIYTPSRTDARWKLYCEKDNNAGCYALAPTTDAYVLPANGTKYQVKGDNPSYSFKTTVNAGVIAIHTHQEMTENKENGDVAGENDKPAVWLERPKIYIWHNWNDNTANWGDLGGAGKKEMTDNNDGTYTYDDQYEGGEEGTHVGLHGSDAIRKYFDNSDASVVGSPSKGDMCRFTWNAEGYLGYGNNATNRGTLTITKLIKITYNDNGSTGGTKPEDEYIMPNTATATYTNTGNLEKTGWVFAGWNTKADRSGTHYDAGSEITLTSDQTLYAEFVSPWTIGGGDGENSDGNTDAMGDWNKYNDLTNTTGTTWRTTMTLAGNTTYTFKVIENASTYYGRNSSFIGQTSVHTMATGEGNCHLLTAGTGTYTFIFDSDSKNLKVLFPDDITHPNADYIYFKNPDWSNVYVHLWKRNGDDTADEYAADSYPGPVPGSTSITTSSGTGTYYYAAIGECNRAKFNNNVGETGTSDITDITTHKGYWWQQSEPYGWKNFTFSVTLHANSGAITDGHDVASYNFGTGATLPIGTYVTRAGYSFAGWYDNEELEGTAVTVISTTDNENKEYWAKWTPVKLTYSRGVTWNLATNWEPNCIPTIEHDVEIASNCWIGISAPDAKAKSVKINYNKRLVIEDGGGLVVAEGITAQHKEDGAYEATTDNDLWIKSGWSYNSGLICGNASANTNATYVMACKVWRDGDYYVNQYVGIPFASMSPYRWHSVYVFEYDAENDAWKNPDDGDLKPFTAYDIISQSSEENWATFYPDGTLNLPGISGDGRLKTLNCGWRAESPASIDKIVGHQDYLFANSWTAPISVENIDEEDYDSEKLVGTIYIFNAGYIPKEGDHKDLGDLAGQWSSISFKAASYITHAVIPATQAFMVTAKAEGATLTLDYKKHVYDPALSDGINNDPLKAPRRTQSTDAPTRLKMTVQIDTVKADILYLFEREDFTSSFDDGWDGYKIMGENFAPQLYAINGESQLAIDAVQDINGTEVGFKAGTRTNEYTFVFDYDDDEPLYLYDKDTQEFAQISNEATYTFTTNDTDEHARFIITRSNNPAVLTAIENSEVVIQAEKFFENGQLFIKRGERMYNATGELVK